jgi:hypothetical protein
MKAQYTGINNKLKTNLKLFFLVPKLVVRWVLGSILCLSFFFVSFEKKISIRNLTKLGFWCPLSLTLQITLLYNKLFCVHCKLGFRNLAKYCKISYMAHIMQWLCLYGKFKQNRNESIKSKRIKLPITDHYPITKHFFRPSSSVIPFEWFKVLWERSLKL